MDFFENPGAVMGSVLVSGLWVMILSYFIGCISPSTMLAKAKGVDIRQEGSGNAGTTNALRVMGKKAGVITLLVDVIKGVVAVAIGWLAGGFEFAMFCVPCVFAGHVWPIFYGFKGGKGVATLFGAIVALNWKLGLAALAVVAAGVLISRRMSVGSITAAAVFPLLCWFIEPEFFELSIVIALLVIIKHRANIGRLIRGEEPKIGAKKESDK